MRKTLFFLSMLFALGLCLPEAGESTALPKLAFAFASTDELLVRAPALSGPGRVLILPPIRLDPAASQEAASDWTPLSGLPADAEVIARVELETGTTSLTGPDLEAKIKETAASVVAKLPLSLPQVSGLLIQVRDRNSQPELLAFTTAFLVTQARAVKKDLRVAISFPPSFAVQNPDVVKRIMNYADAFGTVYGPDWREVRDWVEQHAFNKPLFLQVVPSDAGQAYDLFVHSLMDVSGSTVELLWLEQPAQDTVDRIMATVVFAGRFLTEGFAASPQPDSRFEFDAGGAGRVETKIFLDSTSPSVAAFVALPGSDVPLHIRYPSGTLAEWYDATTGNAVNPQRPEQADGNMDQTGSIPSNYAFLFFRKLGPREERTETSVEVSAGMELSVEEIIARWQQFREWQRERLANYVADCFMNLHFESTALRSGFELSLRLKQFADNKGLVELVQTDSYIDGLKFGKNKEFPLPQLEPDKVVARPLELRLEEKYIYRLLGTDQVNGTLCYVVQLEPASKGENLYSGRVWIDGMTFRQVRMELIQKKSEGNILSNTEVQNFDWVRDDQGNEFNLIQSLHAQQIVNAAGRNFVLERRTTYSGYRLNVDRFQEMLAAARRSDSPMFRETDEGLRQLKKKNGERVVQQINNKRLRSIVAGVLYDGSFDFPIPLLGLSLVDFRYRDTNSQLSVFFAGPILAGNLSRQWSNGFRLGLDLALSGLPENNRVYGGDTELKSQGLWSWEESVGPRAAWQVSTNLNIAAAAYLTYNLYIRGPDADESYVLPRNGVTLTPTLEVKYAKNGYILAGNLSEGKRFGWRQFGFADRQDQPLHASFTKYSAELSKSFYFGRFTRAGGELSYFGGDHLDRFSRYRGSFVTEPRIKGIPGGLDSFDAVAVAGFGMGFNALDFVRFEGSYNHAWGKNSTEWSGYRNYDGLDFEMATAGPWDTYLQGIVSYALRGSLARYSTRWGVYLLIFKPLG
jgi:hypothetical protein